MSDRQKSLKMNFIMNVLLTVASFIFPVVTFPYVSRVLGPDGTGKVAFATSVISYFAMFAQLGIPTYGIRACAKVRDDREQLVRVIHEVLLINFLMSILVYIALGISLAVVPRLRQDKPLMIIISLTIVLNAMGAEWLYKAMEEYSYIAIRSIAFKAIALAAMFLLVREKQDYVIYGGITILASSASNILNFGRILRRGGLRPVGGYNPGRHIKAIMIFFAMSCATTIYTNLDTVMLGFMKSDEEVGYYSAAVKIRMLLTGVVTSLGTVLLPRASYYIEQGKKKEFLAISHKAIHFVLLMAFPLTLFFMLYAREGVMLLSGQKYLPAVLPMQVIMPTLLLIGMTNIMGIQMLIPLGGEKYVLYSEIAGAAADLALNALLIPSMASTGAAIGTLAAETLVWMVQYFVLRAEYREIYAHIRYGLLAAAALAGTAAGYGVKLLGLAVFPTLLLGAVIFFGIYGGVLLAAGEALTIEIKEILLYKWKSNRRFTGHEEQ